MQLSRSLLIFGLLLCNQVSNDIIYVGEYLFSTALETTQYLLDTYGPSFETILRVVEAILEPETMEAWQEELSIPTNVVFPFSCDFIVVGGGAAGSVLARRLSEISEWTVCVFEAGILETPLHQVAIPPSVWTDSPYVWGDLAEPQENVCRGMTNNQCKVYRGKCLGGGTCVNALVATRGAHHDWDRMEKFGVSGWSYDEVLPYFKKLENATGVESNDGPNFRGFQGPLSVESSGYDSKVVESFVEAMKCAGYSQRDYNGEFYIGASKAQNHVKKGKRVSAAKAYVYPVIWERSNLKVFIEVKVTKVLINSSKKAYGIRFKDSLGLPWQCLANKEVIVSAGAFGSPQLLMLSGIGPRGHLESLGIPVIQNLSVGQTLYDQPLYYGFLLGTNMTGEAVAVTGMILDPTGATPAEQIPILNWAVNGKGILTTTTAALGFLNTKSVQNANRFGPCSYCNSSAPYPLDDPPEIEFQLLPYSLSQSDFLPLSQSYLNAEDEYIKAMQDAIGTPSGDTILLLIILLNETSAGHVELRDSNPDSKPKIFLNYFSDPNDIEKLQIAIQEIDCLIETPAYRAINATKIEIRYPGCESHESFSRDYWECNLRTMTTSSIHYTGTCKMGNDSSAVVDSKLKVRGITGLRVCDASVFPHSTTAHTTLPVIMLAERTADLIKLEYGKAIDPLP